MSRYASLATALPSSHGRWLVTGAAGFIGSNLVEALLNPSLGVNESFACVAHVVSVPRRSRPSVPRHPSGGRPL